MCLDKKSLIERIHNGFPADIPIPDIHIYEAEAIDWRYYYTDPEKYAEIRAKKYPMPWPEVPKKHLTDNSDALCFLEPDGALYYWPRIMIDLIENINQNDFDIDPDSRYHSLIFFTGYKHEKFSLFNPYQRQTVLHFLQYVNSITEYFKEEIEKQINEHWGRYRHI